MARDGSGPRVAVIGGSIAGCAVAYALRTSGYDVTVYERSGDDLAERGFGVGMPVPLRKRFVTAGYLDSTMPVHRVNERIWLTRGTAGGSRILWRQPCPAVAGNWGVLWRSLRDRIPDESYRSGTNVEAVRRDGRQGLVLVAGREEQRVDLVVGADGHESMVRAAMYPKAAPTYAGYSVLRTHFPVGLMSSHRWALELLEDSIVTIVFPGGQAVIYLVPAYGPAGESGARLLCWGIYLRPAANVWELVDEVFPADWAEIVRLTDPGSVVVHPVCDLTIAGYVERPFLLSGDAGTIARPHTASGAVKALQDAMSLEEAVASCPSWGDPLAAYDKDRCPAGNEIVELGRRFGHEQVEATPDWTAMGPREMDAWARHMVADHTHYLYENTPDGAGSIEVDDD